MEHIVIIGNGISGVTAARHIRKLSDKKITLISSEAEHFFSRTALMYIYMGHMKFEHTKPYEDWFWKKNRIDLKFAHVKTINTKEQLLDFENGDKMGYDKLIIATGSKSNRFGWKGENLDGVIGLYSKQDLEQLETLAPNKEVCTRGVIVGGGLIGIELTEMLHSRNIPVTFLIRENSFWSNILPPGDSEMITRHIQKHGVELRLNTNLKEINSDEYNRACSITTLETEEIIPCDLVGLTAGVSPNISIAVGTDIQTDRGILVNRYLETNIENIYAIGDCAQQREAIGRRNAVEAVWYTGRMMGETIAQTICGNRLAYKPGHWFNSAKFFDIEYQTYGWVLPTPMEGNEHFHWRHADHTKSITIEYNLVSNQFIGINALGIRMRHEIFDRWLTEKRTIDFVIKNLAIANFNPEFYATFQKEVTQHYQQELADI